MPENFTLDFQEFTLGELEEIEEHTGYSVMGATATTALPIKAIVYLLYVQKRRIDPAFTLDDARAYKITDFNVEPAPDPTLRSPTPLSARSPDTDDVQAAAV